MKKSLLKRIASGTVSLLVLASLTACGGTASSQSAPVSTAPSESTAESTPVEKVAYPDVLKFARTGYFGDASDFPELKQAFMDDFEARYGFKLEVNTIPRTDYMQKVELMIAGNELKGLVNVFGTSDVLNAIYNGTIEPLDDYLKDNETWNALPDNIKNTYKIDGKIWALPFAYSPRSFTRSIRKDWLDKLNLAVPTTVEEFYEVAKAFTEQDPDGNGVKDTYGLTGTEDGWIFQDIFQAFGARLAPHGGLSIGWQPETNTFEDNMLKPEMKEALQFMRDLYSNGYLDPEFATNKGATMREKVFNEKVGSVFYWDMFGTNDAYGNIKKTNPNVEFVEVVGLTGKATKNVNFIMGGASPVVLVAGTDQAKEMVNAYVDIFMGTPEGNISGRFGIEDTTFVMDGNTIVRQIEPSTNVVFQQANLIGEFPNFNYEKFPYVTAGTPEEMELSTLVQTNRIANFNKGIEAGLLYESAYMDIYSETYTLAKADIADLFKTTFAKIISGQVGIDEGIADYKAKMKALGGDQIIKEVTEYYGLPASSTSYS